MGVWTPGPESPTGARSQEANQETVGLKDLQPETITVSLVPGDVPRSEYTNTFSTLTMNGQTVTFLPACNHPDMEKIKVTDNKVTLSVTEENGNGTIYTGFVAGTFTYGGSTPGDTRFKEIPVTIFETASLGTNEYSVGTLESLDVSSKASVQPASQQTESPFDAAKTDKALAA